MGLWNFLPTERLEKRFPGIVSAAPGRGRQGGACPPQTRGQTAGSTPLHPKTPNPGISGLAKGLSLLPPLCLPQFFHHKRWEVTAGRKIHLVPPPSPPKIWGPGLEDVFGPRILGFWGWKGAYPYFHPSFPLSVHENHQKTAAGRKICLIFRLYVENVGIWAGKCIFLPLLLLFFPLKAQLRDRKSLGKQLGMCL